MKVRSVTVFAEAGWPVREDGIREAAGCANSVRTALEAAGFPVQTIRLATPPFLEALSGRIDLLPEFACGMEVAAQAAGFDYLSLGPLPAGFDGDGDAIPRALAGTKRVFLSALLVDEKRGISRRAVRRAAEIICGNAGVEAGGFANLRFAALARVPPFSPYFPAAYHGGGPMRFGLAVEAADLAVDAFTTAANPAEGCAALTRSIERNAAGMEAAVRRAAPQEAFAGIDFCLAPYPEAARSIGTAMERMGVPRPGLCGSALAAALLTGALDAAQFGRTGFCGLMFPVFEDSSLAAATERSALSLADLLLYSTLCGTGLDTVPLPGNSPPAMIEPLLLDLAALALRHGKPLTARLMPIPGKEAGEMVSFDFEYFAPARVMPLPAEPLDGLLASGGSWIAVTPRRITQ